MGVFRFSLEQVLRYRKQLEEEAMQVFAHATQARDQRLREKDACEAAIFENRRKMADPTLLDANERWLVQGYIRALTSDLEQARRDLVVLEEALDKARAELIRKAQERQLLEKLKEKQAERHTRAETHKEQQNYDDIATIRFTPPAI